MAPTPRDDGERLLRSMLGDVTADKMAAAHAEGAFGAFFAEHSIEACFGTIWARPELDLRCRSIATLGMVIALGDAQTVKNHVRAGLANGLTVREIEEILYQAIPYLGYPLAGVAVRAAAEVIAELDDA